MNEYIAKLYDFISSKDSGFAANVKVSDFSKTMSENEDYAKKVYAHISRISPGFGENVDINDYLEAVKKKDATASAEESQTSTTAVYDPISGELLGEVEQKPKEENPFTTLDGLNNVKRLSDDVNLLQAAKAGAITYEELKAAGVEVDDDSVVPRSISTTGKKPVDTNKAKQMVANLRTRTQEEMDYEISTFKLDQKNPYIGSSDVFIDNLFNRTELIKMNINPDDFSGFLKETGYKSLYEKRVKDGIYESGTYARDESLTLEMDKSRMIEAYIMDRMDRDVQLQKKLVQKEQGVNQDFTDNEYIARTDIDLDEYQTFRKKNFATLEAKKKELRDEAITKYTKRLNGEDNGFDFISDVASSALKGVNSRIDDFSASTYDFFGADSIAEEIRAEKEQTEIKDYYNINYSVVSGKASKLNGREYIVSDNGEIYDTEIQTRVTQFLTPEQQDQIRSKAVGFKRDFSKSGMAIEGAGVMADLVAQIAIQTVASKGIGFGGKIALKTRAGRAISSRLGSIGISRDIASAMIGQGVLGMSSGYEQTLKAAREAGISEDKALELAKDAAIDMGVLYAATSLINPRLKAVNAITGESNIIRNAVNAYSKIGKEGAKKVFKQEIVEAVKDFGLEGAKELIQENVQQAGEVFIVNDKVNDNAGRNIVRDTITMDEFINTSILSFVAGGITGSIGSLSGATKGKANVSDLKAISILSLNYEKSKNVINSYVDMGVISRDKADKIFMDIEAYSKAQTMVPGNLTEKQILEITPSISKIVDAQSKKKDLDPAFHEELDLIIEEERKKIKNALQKQSTDEVSVSEAPEVSQEVEREVRDTEELTKEKVQVTTQPKPETVQGVLNRPITLTKLGGSNLDTPIEGNIYVEGQQVVVEDADGNLTEIGNVDEISQSSLDEMGIEISQPDVTPTQDGKLLFRKKGRPVDSMGIPKAERAGVEQEVEEVILTPDKDGIKRNKKGDVTRVTLKDQNGQDVTLRGANAEEAAYQILLSEAMSPEQSAFINEQLENDEEFQNELRKAAESAQEQATTDTEQTVEPTAESTEEVEEDVVSQIDKLLEEDDDGARAMATGKKKPGTIEQAIENVKKALKRIAPNVKIEVYKTTTAFNGALEARGLSKHKSSLGLYDPKTNTIYIDAQVSDAEVVYHEAFHAMLRNVFGTDENIKATVNEMINALRKVLPQDIVNQIDEDLKAYAENQLDEEFVTQIFGQLTDAYRMVPDSRNIIKKFLDKLAKLLGLREFTTSEILDVLNAVSGKMARGEQILDEDINFLGLSGTIEVSSPSEKASLVGKIDLKRFPVNENSIVRKNFKLKTLNGKRSSIMESDRMTGAYVPDAEGNPMFKFFGGLFYPVITGNMWSSSTKSKADGIAKSADANRDEDGYAYMTPLIMRPGSHMSNRTMFAAAWHVMKYDLKSRSNKVTKAKFLEYLETALSQKSVNKSISDFGVNKSDTADTIIDKLAPFMESESEEVTTFEQRKAILRSILGTSSAKTGVRFPSAGTFLEFAGKFEEELTRGRDTYDFSVMYRTKGNLEVVRTTKEDEAHHDSYEWAIKSDDKVEILILDKTYNLSKTIPSVTTSGGKEFSFEDYKKKYDSEKQAVSQYGIWGIRGFSSGEIMAQKATAQYGVNKAKEKGFSDADIRKWGNSKGFTTAEINDAIKAYEEEKRFKGMQEEGLFNPDNNRIVQFFDKARKYLFSAKAFLGKSGQIAMEDMLANMEVEASKTVQVSRKLKKLLKESNLDIEKVADSLDKFLRGDSSVELPPKIKKLAVIMRTHIDSLSKQLVEVGISKTGTESHFAIMSNIGSYMYRSYEVFDNPDYSPSEMVINSAKNYLRNAMRSKAYEIAMRENNDPITVLEEMVDKEIEKILNKNLENQYVNAASNVAAKKTRIMDRRLDIPFEIRALMGEYSDPVVNYAKSVRNISELIEKHKFAVKLKKAGEGIFLFNESTGIYNVQIASENNRSLDPLNGMFTSKEIYNQLQNRPPVDFSGWPWIDSIYKNWLFTVGIVKANKTIKSIATHSKNILSNGFFMAANGYTDLKEYKNSWRVLKNDLLKRSDDELNDKLNEYKKAGIISQGVQIQELRSMISADDDFELALLQRNVGRKLTVENLKDMNLGDAGIEVAKQVAKKGRKGVKKAYTEMGYIYQAEDDFFKIVAYESERKRYAKAFHNNEYENLSDNQKQEVDDYSREIVKNVLPNYSRTGGLAKALKALPLSATFISFEMEAWRTAYNTVKLAADELKDPRTKEIGKRRMKGIMSIMMAKGLIYSSLGLIGGGDDDDEETTGKKVVDAVRNFVYPWVKNANLLVYGVGDGKFTFVNLSGIDPHGSLDKALISMMRSETVVDAFINTIKQVTEPFIDKDIALEAYMEIVNNEDSVTGRPIFLETDTIDEMIGKGLEKLYKAAEPGTITSFRRIASKDGVKNIALETIGQFTGIKPVEITVKDQMFFRSRDIYDRWLLNTADYRRAKRSLEKGEINEQEYLATYERANQNHKEVYQDLVKLYQDAIIASGTPEDLIASMKSSRIPRYVIDGVIQGIVPDLQ